MTSEMINKDVIEELGGHQSMLGGDVNHKRLGAPFSPRLVDNQQHNSGENWRESIQISGTIKPIDEKYKNYFSSPNQLNVFVPQTPLSNRQKHIFSASSSKKLLINNQGMPTKLATAIS